MIAYLKPKAIFAKQTPRSDTLFGAVCWAILMLFGEEKLVELLKEFEEAEKNGSSPPFVLSSLFPYLEGNGERIHILPRPKLRPEYLEIKDLSDYQAVKKLRKAGWVSESVFRLLQKGEIDERRLTESIFKKEDKEFLISKGILFQGAEKEYFEGKPVEFIRSEMPRNAINRLSNSTGGDGGGQLFYDAFETIRTGSKTLGGYYLMMRFGGSNAEKTEEIVKAALRLMGDKGFGGDYSIGRGNCQVEFSDKEILAEVGNPEFIANLSLMYPSGKDRELLQKEKENVFAQIERRKGFLETAFMAGEERVWKPTLLMLSEGSTFPAEDGRKLYGSLFTDKSERKNLEYEPRINGLAFTAGFSSAKR